MGFVIVRCIKNGVFLENRTGYYKENIHWALKWKIIKWLGCSNFLKTATFLTRIFPVKVWTNCQLSYIHICHLRGALFFPSVLLYLTWQWNEAPSRQIYRMKLLLIWDRGEKGFVWYYKGEKCIYSTEVSFVLFSASLIFIFFGVLMIY